jgi:hypothetical protein
MSNVREVFEKKINEVVRIEGQISGRELNNVTIYNITVKQEGRRVGKVDHVKVFDNEVSSGLEVLKAIRRQEVVSLTGKVKVYKKKNGFVNYALTDIYDVKKGYD